MGTRAALSGVRRWITFGAAVVLTTVTPFVSGRDPAPLTTQDQWLFDLQYRAGDVYLLSAAKVRTPEVRETPRAVGRFSLELYEGAALVERVRFDFPLVQSEELTDAGARKPSLGKRVTSRIGVYFPATPRGARLELYDRVSDKTWMLPWPPNSPDAGAL